MATATRITLEEFLALPETEPASEYDCGEVTKKPMPDPAHSLLQVFVGSLILQAIIHVRLGWAGSEMRCVFGPRGKKRSYVPDIVYVSRERVPSGSILDQRFLPAAPDLAVEFLSRGQPDERFNRTIAFYLAHGVRLVWIGDPRSRSVTVLAPDQEPRTLASGDTLNGGDVLPGFEVAVAEIVAQLDV